MLGERFRREKPREVPMLVDAAPVLVFTDGASEEGCHTIGGVLVFPDESEPRFFGSYVPDALVEKMVFDNEAYHWPCGGLCVACCTCGVAQILGGTKMHLLC